jgi:hypothetical protein
MALGTDKQYEVSLGGRLAVFFKPLTDKELFAWRIHKDDLTQQRDEWRGVLSALARITLRRSEPASAAIEAATNEKHDHNNDYERCSVHVGLLVILYQQGTGNGQLSSNI